MPKLFDTVDRDYRDIKLIFQEEFSITLDVNFLERKDVCASG
jgi:hypothetical protein